MRDIVLELEKKNEIGGAERASRELLAMRPDDALTLYRLGRLLATRGAHAEAVRLFSRSLAVEPEGQVHPASGERRSRLAATGVYRGLP